ncbi:MAG: hypothetical protein HUU10_00580 [Bacteroidetes bacterium]|nr:hypothetical protein [Bacteroidota bacterium]
MKKVALLLLALAIGASSVMAQASESYKKGQIAVAGGIGLAATLGGNPLWVSGEYGWSEEIGIGAAAAMSSYEYTAGLWDLTFYQIGVYGIYHKDFLKMANLDTYGKAGVAMIIGSWDYQGSGTAPTEPTIGGFGYDIAAGANYYFMPNLAANVELGFGLALIKVGVQYKL